MKPKNAKMGFGSRPSLHILKSLLVLLYNLTQEKKCPMLTNKKKQLVARHVLWNIFFLIYLFFSNVEYYLLWIITSIINYTKIKVSDFY